MNFICHVIRDHDDAVYAPNSAPHCSLLVAESLQLRHQACIDVSAMYMLRRIVICMTSEGCRCCKYSHFGSRSLRVRAWLDVDGQNWWDDACQIRQEVKVLNAFYSIFSRPISIQKACYGKDFIIVDRLSISDPYSPVNSCHGASWSARSH